MKKSCALPTAVVRALPVFAASLLSGTASAAGFQLLEQNASGIGNAYAGSAAIAENASTIFFNPAGMTQLKAREFSLGLSAVRPSYKFSNNGSLASPLPPPSGTPLTGSNGGDAGDWGFIPNGFLSWGLTKDLYVGVGLSAPFGLKTEYDADWIGRFQSIKFEIKTYNVNPSIAYRINDKVSIGAGVNWQRLESVYERQAAVVNPLAQGTRVKLDLDDDSWGWNVGALFNVSPTTRIGVSYRSAIKHEVDGSLTSNNQLVSPNIGARASIKLPDTAILSVVQRLSDRWEMLGDISWTGWSSIKDVDIFRANGTLAQTLEPRFRDSWRVAFGGIYKYTDAWRLKFGIAWDQTPVPNAEHRLTALPDNDRLWLSIGGQWRPTLTSALDLGFAYLHIKDTDINNDQLATGRGLVRGSYDSSKAYILGAQYSQSF
jgi:long-chain fatty acid transport protein